MVRIACTCLLLLSATLAHAGESAKAAAAKRKAVELRDATLSGNYGKLIDGTYDGVVKQLGGRDKAVKDLETAMKSMKDGGISIQAYDVGEPGEIQVDGTNSFIVIPSVLVLKVPGAKVENKSFLLGISTDAGATWKFVDGARIDDAALRAKLPANLKLPAKQTPKVTPE